MRRSLSRQMREKRFLDNLACVLVCASALPISLSVSALLFAVQNNITMTYGEAIATTVGMGVGLVLMLSSLTIGIVNVIRNS